MTHLLEQFMLAFIATGGFTILFRVPLKHIPVCMCVGGIGWICYEISMYYYTSPVLGCFLGACAVGLLSQIAARCLKDAVTIFVIPGILCLVPGSKIFNTMAAFLQEDYKSAVDVGTQTLMMAGAIAVGLLTMGAIIRVIRSIIRKTINLKELL